MLLGSLLALILACIAVFVVIPTIRPKGFDPYPSRAMIPPLALIAGYGIALPFACFFANSANLRPMLRFTWGRLITVLLFVGFFPIFLWGGALPMAFGLLAISPIAILFENDIGVSVFEILILIPLIIGANGLGYALCCAMIYGLTKRWRIGAFIFTYAGAIALLLLMGLRNSGVM